MQTQQATYLDFLGTSQTQMAIPVFQRVYTWGVWQCEELLEDIVRAGRYGGDHFIGSIVYTHEQGFDDIDFTGQIEGAEFVPGFESNVGTVYSIVDGQQRSTTIYLLLLAIRDHLKTHNVAGALITPEEIDERFLYVEGPKGRTVKFISAPADQETMAAVMNKTELPPVYKLSNHVVDNYNFFLGKLAKGTSVNEVWRGLGQLFAIIIRLDSDDNPQLIFEGLNSRGMSLATSDLLRNKLFYGHDEETQVHLLEDYWEPLEEVFSIDSDQILFHAAVRRWLVEQDSSYEKYTRPELYTAFRKFLNEQYKGTIEELMQELLASCKNFVDYYSAPFNKKYMDWAMDDLKIVTGNRIFG